MKIQTDIKKSVSCNAGGQVDSKTLGHIISHTHWDREWRVPVWHSHWRLSQMMEKLLAKLEQNPDFIFLFDGQVVSLEDYLNICPSKKELVQKYVCNGQLQIGPWYNLPDLYPVCGEALIRNLQDGIRKAESLGRSLKIGYTTFGWGQTAQFPQIYKGFGIDRVVCSKNVSKDRAPDSEFLWQSLDGTQVLTTRLGVEKRANFFFSVVMPSLYGCAYSDDETRIHWGRDGWLLHRADHDIDSEYTCLPNPSFHPETLDQSIQKAIDTTKESLASQHLFFGNGCDSTGPNDVVDRIIDHVNKKWDSLELRYSDIITYFDSLENEIQESGVELKTVVGELRDGPVHHLSANALATRMPLKILNREAQNSLIRYAEAFSTLLPDSAVFRPEYYLEKAWNYLLLAHSHDALNGVTLDKTAEDTAYKLRQTIELSRVVMDMTASALLHNVDLSEFSKEDVLLAVFNPTPLSRSHVMQVTLDIPEEDRCRRLAVMDRDGSVLSVQPIDHESCQLPVHVQNSRALPFYADRHSFFLETGDIPAYGYKVLKVIPVEPYQEKTQFWLGTYEYGSQVTGPNRMENSFLMVKINPDGTYDLTQKQTGQYFAGLGFYEDGGDVGDYWQRVKPNHDRVYTSHGCPTTIYLIEDGPLVTTYRIEQLMTLPAEAKKNARFNTSRSESCSELKIVTELTVKKNIPYLQVKTTVWNQTNDHRLRVGFPTSIQAEHSVAMGHFNVDRRPVARPYQEGIRDGEMGTLPMQHFVDLSNRRRGLAVLNKNLIEYEVSENRNRTLYFTLLRCVDVKICTEARCATIESNAQGAQCHGEHQFEYALYPHSPKVEISDVYEKSEHFVLAPVTYQMSHHEKGSLPASGSFLSLNDPAIQISCIKKAVKTNGIVIRLYNPMEEMRDAVLTFARDISEAWLTDLNETRTDRIDLGRDHQGLSFSMQANKIITVEVVFS